MKPNRQAIVVIHGIGEQRPTVTLRDFIDGIVRASKQKVEYWYKPDTLSGNYETRKMMMQSGPDHPRTDFYEFYWAHHLRDTRLSHISDWLKKVVLRKPGNVSKRLLPPFLFLWSLTFLFAGFLLWYGLTYGFHKTGEIVTLVTSSAIYTTIMGFFSVILFNYLGDAARYLDPSPENISERMNIRTEGVALLRKLHESGKYDKIVVVGHSLGSVIAYDIIKFMWDEYYKTYDPDKVHATCSGADLPLIRQIDASEQVWKKTENVTSKIYQDAQEKTFEYLRCIGNKWLITDLVTIGSPLAHAGHLFVYRKDLFEQFKKQREYPTCPPTIQAPDTSNIHDPVTFTVAGAPHPYTVKRFNHSSLFAATKWTNIYYTTDFVGGPLNPLFGKGILDVKLERKSKVPIYPAGHTCYWDEREKINAISVLWDVIRY